MFTELWEGLRGYHKWTETQAVLESAAIEKTRIAGEGDKMKYSTAAAETLAWYDQGGQKHSAAFTVPEDSSLFKLVAGERVTIRYNPSQPNHFYLRELLRVKVERVAINIVVGIAAVLIIVVFVVLPAMARIYRTRHSTPLW